MDTSFATFKSIALYVIYDPKQAAKIKDDAQPFRIRGITRDPGSTLVNFSINEVIIDRKGVFKDYTGMQFLGVWGMSRLGDKVPLEYQPLK